MENLVFFTINDFEKEGGGTIRMLGIINELAKVNNGITLISNLTDYSKVHVNVKHIFLNYNLSSDEKRKIQFILALFGTTKVNSDFAGLSKKLQAVFASISSNSKFIFFEYLDNSIGYWMKMNKTISNYTNDIHGIASNEFDFQEKKSTSLKRKLFFRLKKVISQKLDKKVFENADGIFYASDAMLQYFIGLYPSLQFKQNFYLPYVLNNQNVMPPKTDVVERLKKELKIQKTDFIFLFAGSFKETGGIQDLLIAFGRLSETHKNAKLILVGDGPTFKDCTAIHNTLQNKNSVFFLGRQPYNYLTSFQEIAHVIVCPDRQNLFSELIVHVKYLDSLVSGKLVINGSFKSVLEINKQKQLSLLFKPSDIDDLSITMKEAVDNYDKLSCKFADSKAYSLENLTYTNFIANLY